jgi:hypothetical protein
MEPGTAVSVNFYAMWMLSVVVGFGLFCGVCVGLAVADLVGLICKGVQRVIDYALSPRPKPR